MMNNAIMNMESRDISFQASVFIFFRQKLRRQITALFFIL